MRGVKELDVGVVVGMVKHNMQWGVVLLAF